jgi:ADP-heptose:LPS heptosyltransferase
MHLASASRIPTIGLFSPTNADMYMPYNTHSFAMKTENKTIEECVTLVEKVLKPKSEAIL